LLRYGGLPSDPNKPTPMRGSVYSVAAGSGCNSVVDTVGAE
jgi:hypothetical protein